jgi:hypothetical protein
MAEVPDTAMYQLHVSLGTDTTPPSVEEVSPADLLTGVATTANVTATFSEPVQNVSTETFILERKIAVKKAPRSSRWSTLR